MTDTDDEFLTKELKQLEIEHQDLNQIIDVSEGHEKLDQVTMQRLKKRKLFVKDRIQYLKSSLFPDIIA